MSKFKEYYEDEEFRERHLAYLREKIECPVCKKMISRVNMARHIKTTYHGGNSLDLIELMKKKKKVERNYRRKAKELKAEKNKELEKIEKRIKEYNIH